MQNVRGTQDFEPFRVQRIQKICQIIREHATNLGADEIDTPCLEYSSLLLDKYGEEAEDKLIYRIKKWSESEDKNDGEGTNSDAKADTKTNFSSETALRYDMTVPFMRYFVSRKIDKMRRFQVGKVFRKDVPYPQRGRFCEFIQADYDIVGNFTRMLPEAEILKLISLVMNDLGIVDYRIKINFRQNLETIVTKVAGIDPKMFQSVCCSIDKLDKRSWTEVEEELAGKGIGEEALGLLKRELGLEEGKAIPFPVNEEARNDMVMLYDFLKVFKCEHNVVFDAKLARGLDYYTGMIYEVVLTKFPKGLERLGSVIAGGRYDRMLYRKRKKGNIYFPAIGVSFGINRLELVLPPDFAKRRVFNVLVVSQPEFLKRKLEVVNLMLEEGHQVKYFDEAKKNVNQINWGIKNNYNYIVIVGEDGEGKMKVKRNDNSSDQLTTVDQVVKVIEKWEMESLFA